MAILEVEHLKKTYTARLGSNRVEALRDVNFNVEQGEFVAIMGESGSGKTTLCNLMARFWDVQGGSVRLGGRDVREYSYDSLIRNFSFVFQRTYLFSDTIANNIRFGKPDASMEEVQAAAKKARCYDFIMALPDGFDTVIGEGGSSLSGGGVRVHRYPIQGTRNRCRSRLLSELHTSVFHAGAPVACCRRRARM